MMRRLLLLFGLSFLGNAAASSAIAQPWEPVGAEAFVAIAGMSDGALVMVREPGDILRSSDRGATWHQVYHGMRSLTAIGTSHDTAYAFFDSVAVLISLDSGRTWTGVDAESVQARKPRHYNPVILSGVIPTAKEEKILANALVDSVCYVVGEPGLIYVSDASKTQWRRLHVAPFCSAKTTPQPPPFPLRSIGGGAAIDFYSAASGAIARDSLLFITQDSGTTWQEVRSGLRATGAMLMLSDTSVLVGDTSGNLNIAGAETKSRQAWTLARTQDSGLRSNIIQIGWRNKPNGDIYFVTDSALYLTTTRFESVTPFPLPLRVGEHVRSASFPDPYTCYVLADSVTRLDTTTVTDNITHDTTIYRDTACIYQSTDGGATWTGTASGLAGLTKIFFTSAKNGYACGPRGTMLLTQDSGLTWHKAFASTRQDLHDIRFVNDSVGYAAGDSGVVLVTQNRGRWWRNVAPEPLFTHPTTSYQSLAFPDAHKVYALGIDRCYRQTIRDPMSGFRFNRRTQQKNTLAVTASPNPSSGFVRFTIASKQSSADGSAPTLTISDASGRTIEQIPNLSGSAMNTWAASADFSNLTTGAYTAIASLGGASGLCKFAIAH